MLAKILNRLSPWLKNKTFNWVKRLPNYKSKINSSNKQRSNKPRRFKTWRLNYKTLFPNMSSFRMIILSYLKWSKICRNRNIISWLVRGMSRGLLLSTGSKLRTRLSLFNSKAVECTGNGILHKRTIFY